MRTPLLVLVLLAVSACSPAAVDGPTIRGTVSAGPVCPVVTDPPDPACDDRPIAGAEMIVRNEAGEDVARVRSMEDGTFAIELAPGRYQFEPQPVDGMMGTAAPIEVIVVAGPDPEPITVSYDTGIR